MPNLSQIVIGRSEQLNLYFAKHVPSSTTSVQPVHASTTVLHHSVHGSSVAPGRRFDITPELLTFNKHLEWQDDGLYIIGDASSLSSC
jgi:hypothetical protein